MSASKKANEGAVTTIADDALVMAIGSNGYQPISFADLAKAVRGTLQIGGRNLVPNSANAITTNKVVTCTLTVPITDYPAGTPVTCSFDYEFSNLDLVSNSRFGIQVPVKNMGSYSTYVDCYYYPTTAYGKGRAVNTVILPAGMDIKTHICSLFVQKVNGGTFKVSNFKMEIGNIATAWTPAPEDIASGNWGGVIGLILTTYNSEEKGGAHDSEKAESVTIDYASESECANPLELRGRICSHQPFKVDSDDVYAECESLFSDGLPIHKRAMDRVCTDSTKLGHLNGCAKRGCACMFWLDYGHKSKSDLLLHSRNKTKQFANFCNLDGTLLSVVDGGRATVVGKYLVVVKERKEVVAA